MMPARVSEAFAFQSKACASLGSPFMGRLMQLCATRDWPEGTIRDRVAQWPGDLGPREQSVPLRLAGALHALVLGGYRALGAVYPPNDSDDDALWRAVRAALIEQDTFIGDFIDSPPQTNEVRRAATLIAVGHLLAERHDLPIRTSELGASGGLNLHWDRYALKAAGQLRGPADAALTLRPDWNGAPPPVTPPRIASRAGIDLNPLDPAKADDALRLQAYLWPDQPERLALTRAAIAVAKTRVDEGDAIDWLLPRLAHKPGTLHLIYTTIAWQYFPTEQQHKGRAAIAAAGAAATDEMPLAWFGMENDGGERGAALTLRLWPGDRHLDLGRADFHGRWIDWRPA